MDLKRTAASGVNSNRYCSMFFFSLFNDKDRTEVRLFKREVPYLLGVEDR